MPCYSIRSTKVAFEKVAYKPAHLDLLTAALQEMGYQVQRSGTTLKIWPISADRLVRGIEQDLGGETQMEKKKESLFAVHDTHREHDLA